MPINTNKLIGYESTNEVDGVGNLGGALVANAVSSNVNDFFDLITPEESADAGQTHNYRCWYIRNDDENGYSLLSGNVSLIGGPADANTRIGIAVLPKNQVAESLTNEETSPAGVTFQYNDNRDPIQFSDDLAPGEFVAVWMHREVSQGVGALTDNCTVQLNGATAP